MDILSGNVYPDTKYPPTRDENGAVVTRSVRELVVSASQTRDFLRQWLADQYHRTDKDKNTEIVRVVCSGVLLYEELPPTMRGAAAIAMRLADQAAMAKALKDGNRYPRLSCDAATAAPAPADDIDARIAAAVAKALADQAAKTAPAPAPAAI